MTSTKPLLAVPNVSEGRDRTIVQATAQAFTEQGLARLLDVHSDVDHHRSVFTLAGIQGDLSQALLAGTRTAIERIDVGAGRDPADIGEHPHVGAVDVIPVVYLEAAQRGAACAEALVVAHEVGDRLGVPVLLYGELAGGRTRAQLRRGGGKVLAERIGAGELRPDFGPSQLHPTAGATLVAAREPLVAFNLELAASATVEDARRIAGLIREGGAEGLPGVRAIGIPLRRSRRGEAGERHGEDDMGAREDVPHSRARVTSSTNTAAQVSMNVERPLEVPLRAVVEAVRRHAEIARGEIVGLAPRAALEGFPEDVELLGFDPGVHVIENALGF
jgi:glutamate formiminotransferase / 5-formyltetrahydrofolate cyclo-ligase